MIIGERSNGKTYSVKELVYRKYIETGKKFMYVRKRQDSIPRTKMKKLFADVNEDIIFPEIGETIQYSTESGFYIEDENGDRQIVGYATSIENFESLKGIPFNDITTIFYDEFIERRGDIEGEFDKFLNLVSTIVRKRDDVEIYMCANTITKFSIYFEEFGIDIKKLKRGNCYYLKHENGAEIAIEFCDSLNIVKGKKQKNRYYGFDNSSASKMILYGEWEYDVVNISNVDGIGWESMRYLVPCYVTALGECYEMSIYKSKNPILFVRKPNTQNGFVRKEIRYNFSIDNSIILTTVNGVVPMYGRCNELVSDDVRECMKVVAMCLEAKRVVFDSLATGSDFTRVVGEVL